MSPVNTRDVMYRSHRRILDTLYTIYWGAINIGVWPAPQLAAAPSCNIDPGGLVPTYRTDMPTLFSISATGCLRKASVMIPHLTVGS